MKYRLRFCNKTLGLLVFFLVLAVSFFSNSSLAKPKAYVTSYPLKYFVERIACENVDIVFPVPEGENPILWMPDPETIADMQQADLIILNGATYEKWLSFISLPPSKLVDTSVGFKDDYIHAPNTITHSHGSQGKHSHTGVRHTTWLDFYLAAKQAKAIEKALSRLMPDIESELKKNYVGLERDLLRLDRKFDHVFTKISNQRFLASHPEYDYLARHYALTLQSLFWSPKVMPSPDQWKGLSDLLDKYPAKWMIWEEEPIKETFKKLDSMGIQSLVFHPGFNSRMNLDFMTMMDLNLRRLCTAFDLPMADIDEYDTPNNLERSPVTLGSVGYIGE